MRARVLPTAHALSNTRPCIVRSSVASTRVYSGLSYYRTPGGLGTWPCGPPGESNSGKRCVVRVAHQGPDVRRKVLSSYSVHAPRDRASRPRWTPRADPSRSSCLCSQTSRSCSGAVTSWRVPAGRPVCVADCQRYARTQPPGQELPPPVQGQQEAAGDRDMPCGGIRPRVGNGNPCSPSTARLRLDRSIGYAPWPDNRVFRLPRSGFFPTLAGGAIEAPHTPPLQANMA